MLLSIKSRVGHTPPTCMTGANARGWRYHRHGAQRPCFLPRTQHVPTGKGQIEVKPRHYPKKTAMVLFAECYCLTPCDEKCMSIVDDKPRLELKFHLTAKTPLEGPPGLPVMRQVSFDPSTPLDGEEVAEETVKVVAEIVNAVEEAIAAVSLAPVGPAKATAAVSLALAEPAKATATVPLTPEKATEASAAVSPAPAETATVPLTPEKATEAIAAESLTPKKVKKATEATAAVSPAPAGPAKETATVPLTPEKATVATAALKSILKPAKKP